MKLTDREIAIVKGMLRRKDRQHDIAAYFGVNGGRIAEVATGDTGPDISPADASLLPPPGPYLAGRSAILARDTLLEAHRMIASALAGIDMLEKVKRE